MTKKINDLGKKLREREVTAKNVKTAANISYRRINDWDAKDVLPKKTGGSGSWRRFTGADVIKIVILSKLVELGISIRRLKKLKRWMSKPRAIEYLVDKYSYGLNMFLCTDLEENFGFDDESAAYDLVLRIGDVVEHPTIVLPLNRILDKFFEEMGIEKTEIDNDLRLVKLCRTTALKGSRLTETEEKILRILREEKKYQTVKVKVKDGKIVHIAREESFPFNQ